MALAEVVSTAVLLEVASTVLAEPVGAAAAGAAPLGEAQVGALGVGVGLGLAGAYAGWGPGWGGDPCRLAASLDRLGLALGASERLLVIGPQ